MAKTKAKEAPEKTDVKTESKSEETKQTVETEKKEQPNKGTTESLFPEYYPTDESSKKSEDVKGEKKEEVSAKTEVKTEVKQEAKEEIKQLPLEEFGERMVPLNVNGTVEMVPLKDIVRRAQTDKALTLKGQKVAEDRKQLDAILASLKKQEEDNKAKSDTKETTGDENLPQVTAKEKKLEKELTELKGQLQEMTQITQPIRYQQNLDVIAKQMKDKGFSDFKEYIPRIEKAIMELSVELQPDYDSAAGFVEMYNKLKMEDLRNQIEEAKTNKTETKTEGKKEEKREVKIVKVEGGGGSPSGANDDSASYDEAFKEAQRTGKWAKVLEMKGALGP